MKNTSKPPTKKNPEKKKHEAFELKVTDRVVFDLLRDAAVATFRQKLISAEIFGALAIVCQDNDVVQLLDEVIPRMEATVVCLQSLEEIRAHLAIISLVKKFPFTRGYSDEERTKAAFTTWLSCEASCHRTNSKFMLAKTRKDYSSFDHRTRAILARARLLIEECLTCLGSLDDAVMYSLRNGRFGPGMSLCSKNSRDTTAYHKLSTHGYSVTQTASSYFAAAISDNRRWVRYLIRRDRDCPTKGTITSPAYRDYVYIKRACKVVSATQLTFVEKTAKTKRPITIGPLGNMYLQLGAEGWIRKSLKRAFGINLNDASNNRYMAWKGSHDGTTATVDLSSASDRIAYELVRWLLPSDWFAFLDDLRETHATYDGNTYYLHKFAGMGNGYTFALESLVFYALTRATSEVIGDSMRSIAIHGDDIACGTSTAQHLSALFDDIGLKMNTEKSCLSGPFREACGYDFWNGKSIRQYYLDTPTMTASQLIATYNGILCTAYRNALDAPCMPWLMGPTLDSLLLQLPVVAIGESSVGNIMSDSTFGETRYLVHHNSPDMFGYRKSVFRYSTKPVTWNRGASGHLIDLLTWNAGRRVDVIKRGVVRERHRSSHRYRWNTPPIGHFCKFVAEFADCTMLILLSRQGGGATVPKSQSKDKLVQQRR